MKNQKQMKKILVVDDNYDNLIKAEKAYAPLSEYGYTVKTTTNPTEAFHHIHEDKCDILVTDLMFAPNLPEAYSDSEMRFDSKIRLNGAFTESYEEQWKSAIEYIRNPANTPAKFEKNRLLGDRDRLVREIKNPKWPVNYKFGESGMLKPLGPDGGYMHFIRGLTDLANSFWIGFKEEKPGKFQKPFGNILFAEARRKGLEAAIISSMHRHGFPDQYGHEIREVLMPIFLEFPELVLETRLGKEEKGFFYFDEEVIHPNAKKEKLSGWYYGGGYHSKLFKFLPWKNTPEGIAEFEEFEQKYLQT